MSGDAGQRALEQAGINWRARNGRANARHTAPDRVLRTWSWSLLLASCCRCLPLLTGTTVLMGASETLMVR